MAYKYNVFTRKLDYYQSQKAIVDWQESVLSKTTEYGAASASGTNRYIAPSTSGTWTADNIYQYNGATATWDETVVDEGMAVWIEDEDKIYVYNGVAWVKLGSTTYNYWTFAVDGVTKDDITSTDILDFVGGNNVTITRSAEDQITIAAEGITNLDGGAAGSVYGGIAGVDGGDATSF